MHKECVVQLPCLGDEAHRQGQDVRSSGIANQNVAIVGERNDEDQAVLSVMKLIEKLTDEEVDAMNPEIDVDLSRSWTYQFLRSPTESWIAQIVNMST